MTHPLVEAMNYFGLIHKKKKEKKKELLGLILSKEKSIIKDFQSRVLFLIHLD